MVYLQLAASRTSEELSALTDFVLKTAAPAFLVLVVLWNQWRYINRIKKGTLPSGVTWMIWSFVAGVMFYSQLKEKGFESAWMFLGYAVGAMVTMAATIKTSKFDWQLIHKICFILAIIALAISILLSGKVGLYVNLAAHVIGSTLLWHKIWVGHSREPIGCWLVWLCCSSSNLILAVLSHNLLIAPLYYCSHNIVLNILLLWKQPRATGRVTDETV